MHMKTKGNRTGISGTARKRMVYFKKNLPLTLMALPAVVIMILFRYLPLSGILLAFKKFNVRKGIFGSEYIGLDNFKFYLKAQMHLLLQEIRCSIISYFWSLTW